MASPPLDRADSDVSPTTVLAGSEPASLNYFPGDESTGDKQHACTVDNSTATSLATTDTSSDSSSKPKSTGITFSPSLKIDSSVTNRPVNLQTLRKMSASSISFRPPKDPSLPQGVQRPDRKASPPPPDKFHRNVGFDNLADGETSKHSFPALTLKTNHAGYKETRRSRTFMAGVDGNTYSWHALNYLLTRVVDDGDQIVCVRVIDKDSRLTDKQHAEAAASLMESIVQRNTANRSLSIVLEYAVGKIHTTFQSLIYLHEPAMLVVGTRGRSLGGLQGLVKTRNSFSKYCLQYSPVPVVVVRPDDKRSKKKDKRANDISRQTYINMLTATAGKHEADCKEMKLINTDPRIPAALEAHHVAKAIGLPASFDPTVKPYTHATQTVIRAPIEERRGSTVSPAPDGDSDSDSDVDETEFDASSGQQVLEDQVKMEHLHQMEVGEAAALKMRRESEDDDDDDNLSDQEGRPSQNATVGS